MLWTRTLIPTMKETPEGAEIPSHVLMLRAGLVNQVMAGAYTYLPLGLRALKKAERIVREEMDAAGAVELAMPAMSPLALWEQTGRVAAFGDVLVQFTAPAAEPQGATSSSGRRTRRSSPTWSSRQISSYRQMPITLYQITQVPQRGAAAVRRAADQRVPDEGRLQLRRLGRIARPELREDVRGLLPDLRPLRAGLSGRSRPRAGRSAATPATSSWSRPKTARTPCCTARSCGYAANQEKAEIGARDCVAARRAAAKPLTKVATPGASTIEQVSKFLKCKPQKLIKTLIYVADGKPIAVLVRGDHEANEGKIRRARKAAKLELAAPEVIEKVTGAPVGFAGPVGMKEKIPILADRDVQRIVNARDRRERGRRAPDRREPAPRFRGRPVRRPAQRRRRRSLPAVQRHAGAAARDRGRATSSSSARSTPRPSTPSSSTPTSNSSRSSWAATASA